ncbi:hypothetical protein PQE20_03780 [Vibrio harveyi]|uniref:hypothetical protein n=1 Tax=Vibrio harveyi TaxID=669 RepID=UPI00234CDC9B|nr:hypothetical protein [Vibrio harveyi]WCP81131.1 hypothetical protein PQE20_03780 [Vibrio harveyi]
MDFEVQSEEMKNTILHAAIGEVALEASALECLSELLLDLQNGEDLADKKLTLGRTISHLKQEICFPVHESEVLENALAARNKYAHQLPRIYTGHITNQGSMRSLIDELIEIKKVIAKATDLVEDYVRARCLVLGTSFDEISERALVQYESWTNT